MNMRKYSWKGVPITTIRQAKSAKGAAQRSLNGADALLEKLKADKKMGLANQ